MDSPKPRNPGRLCDAMCALAPLSSWHACGLKTKRGAPDPDREFEIKVPGDPPEIKGEKGNPFDMAVIIEMVWGIMHSQEDPGERAF
jgi:hypothetical protein